MILNNQLGGEAMWFWYATVFRKGARLYSGLHIALQPLFVLETASWMALFGKTIIAYEIPSLVHAAVLAVGFFLILRESDWPDWQKAVLLLGSFVFTVLGHSYRFDDYHVIAEFFIVYALWLLLRLGRPVGPTHPTRLVFALAVLSGLTFVTRVTDGAALLVAVAISLCFLLNTRVLMHLVFLAVVAALTVVLVVKLTGDSLSAYLMSSIFKAAGSKGGTGSIFAAPWLAWVHALEVLRGMKVAALSLLVLLAVGWALARYRPRAVSFIVPAQLLSAAIFFSLLSPKWKGWYRNGAYYEFLVLLVTSAMYAALGVVLVRFARRLRGGGDRWDPREALVVLPILEWASYSAGAAAEPLTNYYAPVVLLLLLIPVLQPFRRVALWANPSLVTIFALVAFWGVYVKVQKPYAWQNYSYPPLFEHREWYRHPVYGPMYIDHDLLAFSTRVCSDIHAPLGQPGPELLSLPYPYPNYFCNTPPWHNYVQTFFDTAPRATVEHMIQELQTHPPQWIVYQRQINIMVGAERLYNHGKPIAQRDLDALIMGNIASGHWKLVDESSYLRPDWWPNARETDWYIIQTRP